MAATRVKAWFRSRLLAGQVGELKKASWGMVARTQLEESCVLEHSFQILAVKVKPHQRPKNGAWDINSLAVSLKAWWIVETWCGTGNVCCGW